jgi:hypothetical protein
MSRILSLLLSIISVTVIASCSKKDAVNSGEGSLYGIWVKGSAPGDTLRFVNRNGINYMLLNERGISQYPSSHSIEYKYEDDKLYVKDAYGGNFWQLHSFTWQERGLKFDVQAPELYWFVAVSPGNFTYRKIL